MNWRQIYPVQNCDLVLNIKRHHSFNKKSTEFTDTIEQLQQHKSQEQLKTWFLSVMQQ